MPSLPSALEGCTCLWAMTSTSAYIYMTADDCPVWPHERHFRSPEKETDD